MKIISWNINGLRAIAKKGFLDFFLESDADILCLQEIKANRDQIEEKIQNPTEEYTSYWSSAEKKGYSGTAIYSKIPMDVSLMNIKEFDNEGRVLIGTTDAFTLINAYFPNSQHAGKRLDYKIAFCDAMLELCNTFTTQKKPLILCGDYNIAHKSIDLARPDDNENSPGYLPEERAWMDVFTASGYTDTFRKYCNEKNQYTWWSYRTKARERNIGWRIDYFCANAFAMPLITNSTILSNTMGSDHCPIELEMHC